MTFRILMQDRDGHKAYTKLIWDYLLPVTSNEATVFETYNEAAAHAIVLGRKLGTSIDIHWYTLTSRGDNGCFENPPLRLSIVTGNAELPDIDVTELYLEHVKPIAPELSYINLAQHDPLNPRQAVWETSPNMQWIVEQERTRLDNEMDF